MARLPAGHATALERLLTLLDGLAQPWALTGSTSFALQGIDLDPGDIDVQTDRVGAGAIGTRLEEHAIAPIAYRASGRLRSWFGRFELAGVEVEVMGDLERFDGDGWVGPIDVSDHLRSVHWREYRVPVLDLAYEARAYEELGRTGRAEQLRAHLR